VVASVWGARPRVKVFRGATGAFVRTLSRATVDSPGGVRVAAGDVPGDGRGDVVVGAGPGGPPRVLVFDGATGARVQDYFAFDPSDRSGVHLAVGDVTGDGYADVVAGQGSGGGGVKVFSGKDTASFSNLEGFPGMTGGVRVRRVDAAA